MKMKMATSCGNRLRSVALVLTLAFCLYEVEGRDGGLTKDSSVFDVTKFGAKGNGKPVYDPDTGEALNALSFIRAWQKACHGKGPATVKVPKGTYSVAQVAFSGPCEAEVTVDLQGDIVPDPDRSQFANNELILFQGVSNVIFTGSGSIDAQRQSQQTINPDQKIDFFALMPSMKLLNVTNVVVDGIKSKNPSAFHVLVAQSRNVTIRNVNFDASTITPNTDSDGVYISASSLVSLSNSFIRTGDECVTISPGTADISVTGVTCANGQGIGIGADSYTGADLNVKAVTVRNCTFKHSAFGVRIFPRPQVKPSTVSNVIFEDLVMEGVQNPMVINQQAQHLATDKAVQAKITDLHFRNIRGTAATNNIVSFTCSPQSPCEGIEVADINVNAGKPGLVANCFNTKVVFNGKHGGLNCAVPQ